MAPDLDRHDARATCEVLDRSTEAFNWHDVPAIMAPMTGGRGLLAGHVGGTDVFRVRDGLVAEKLSYVKG